MSTEKQKSKSTIITITVLSVLLALAVTATIVLAAFQASQRAKTTITFGSGITLTVTGITPMTDDSGYTFAWDATVGGSSNKTGSITNQNGDQAISLDAISLQVAGTAAYVAVLPSVTYTDDADGGTVQVTYATLTTPSGAAWVKTASLTGEDDTTTLTNGTNWYVYAVNSAAATIATGTPTNVLNSVEIVPSGADGNVYAGRTYTATIQIAAADTLEELNEVMGTINTAIQG